MYIFQRWKLKSLQKKVGHLFKNRQANQVGDAQIQKGVAPYYSIGEFYDKHQFCKNCPNAALNAIENYRAAAALNDRNAQYLVGQRLMEQGKFWDEFQQTIYACQAQKDYASAAYKEAFAYLESANRLEHSLAKRMIGLAYINGWGVEKDTDKGFKLVVESIEQEGAWDDATKIFESLGLNKPEFFSSIMSLKKGK